MLLISSSESDNDIMSLHNTSDECSISSENKECDVAQGLSLAPELEKYVVVRVKLNVGSKNYIALELAGPDSDDDYEVKFMKLSQKIRDVFVLSEEDLASVHVSDILVTL